MCFFKKRAIKKLRKKLKAMHHYRQANQPRDEVLKKEMHAYRKLAKIYYSLLGKKQFPYAYDQFQECLRAGARMDDTDAQFKLGKHLLDEGRMRQELEKEGVFASAFNARKMHEAFEEGHAMLDKAQSLGHIQAKRLMGLSYINGWGVPADKEKGFELVVASIEQEKAWDKLPQIFSSIGLNKPEFFEALMKRRKY